MHDLEEQYTLTNNDRSKEAINKGQEECIRWLGMQDSILKQKAKINWFEEGYPNTKYSTVLSKRERGGCNCLGSRIIETNGFKKMTRLTKQIFIILNNFSISITNSRIRIFLNTFPNTS